ncbi:MAG: hypothetical protein UT39_C0010G0015 [Candidatus Woesebacteria bacterium GW2011_GWA1_39_21]|uniref:Uncharacterized protein n=1 Tax=Candidatus Woesebacteria bacterium GW2011_GWA1_39_21 TaxID=1618550 RepID=A0A0G0RBX7_9BACT|nr:MAG: hypothetical protein UT39_C0010G0015 [Candidatus Woesebacteria bacterium GW2011_GWA1_39_21]
MERKTNTLKNIVEKTLLVEECLGVETYEQQIAYRQTLARPTIERYVEIRKIIMLSVPPHLQRFCKSYLDGQRQQGLMEIENRQQ